LRGSSFVWWRGIVIELESASRLDQFFVHFSVGVTQDRFLGNVDQTDYDPIIELNARAALKPKKPSANCEPLSDECLRNLRSTRDGRSVTAILRTRMVTTSSQINDGSRNVSRSTRP